MGRGAAELLQRPAAGQDPVRGGLRGEGVRRHGEEQGDVMQSLYRVPINYRLKVYGFEGHKNGANQILILCMFFST